jgi:signal transduction histidine kinase
LPVQVDAVRLLRGMEPTLRTLLGKGVAFRLDCELSEVEIAMPPVELEQLVLNLCMNARDAMSGLKEGQLSVSLSRDLDSVALAVTDNGCGMDEAVQLEIFEPFYSTKPGHSGVGLSAVYGIVERAGGDIALTSAVGQGSTFRIKLPVLQRERSVEPPWAF